MNRTISLTTAAILATNHAAWMRSKNRPNNYSEDRGYLGMSGIGYCPRSEYFRVVDPRPANDRLNWYNWIGYTVEGAVVELLNGMGTPVVDGSRQIELIASFDPRYRGHIDGLLEDNTLIEIKSTYWNKFRRLRAGGQPAQPHYDQVQSYLRHGGYKKAVLIYACRDLPHLAWEDHYPWLADTFTEAGDEFLPFWFADIPRDEARMDYLDAKAQRILAAVDSGKPPKCECAYCER